MNKTAIKNFAVWARVQLIEAVKQKAFEYRIKEVDGQLSTDNCPLSTDDCPLSTTIESEQRKALLDRIDAIGYAQTMEEAAYTWFNRFIALRFMEVNGYLPSKVRVFTDETGAFKPEILKQAISVEIDGLDREKVLDLLDKQDNEELYKYLIITQCNALNAGLPYMFEKIANWTELLFPNNLLRPDSVIATMVSAIPEEDWTDAVQIIGWLYQYYNAELKDETFALLKKNVKITKERIPAATQLFTPDWIVRYMVENSLGRILVDSLQWTVDSEEARVEREKQFAEKMGWKYYLPEAPQTPEVRKQLSTARYSLTTDFKVENLKIIDPCMGSGHILVYAFDVLMQIYASFGWSEREAAKSILENNLYGLDIDDRAGQLAYFAVMMKARKYNRRILNGEVKTNVMSIQDSNWMTDEFIAFVAGKDADIKADLILLRKIFKDAKEYGSILNVPDINYDALYERINTISQNNIDYLSNVQHWQMSTELLLPLVKQTQIMAQKYDVVVTNPPYMGASGMSGKLSEFIKKNYPDSKSDLFAVFMERCAKYTKANGYQAMITQHAWMFLSSFEKLRGKLLRMDTVNMAHLGARAFEEIGGEVVQTTSFVLKNTHTSDYKGTYCRLIDPTTQQGKEDMFLAGENRYTATQSNFSKIPGSPVAYWLCEKALLSFSGMRISQWGIAQEGIKTGDNDRFLRFWYEVEITKTNIRGENSNKWISTAKAGEHRRWYGSHYIVTNFADEGKEIIATGHGSITGKQNLYKHAISWNRIATDKLAFRYIPKNFITNMGGLCFYPNNEKYLFYILSYLNSKVAEMQLNVINPTMSFPPGTINSLGCIESPFNLDMIVQLGKNNVSLAKENWDSFEISWDFNKHPLV